MYLFAHIFVVFSPEKSDFFVLCARTSAASRQPRTNYRSTVWNHFPAIFIEVKPPGPLVSVCCLLGYHRERRTRATAGVWWPSKKASNDLGFAHSLARDSYRWVKAPLAHTHSHSLFYLSLSLSFFLCLSFSLSLSMPLS